MRQRYAEDKPHNRAGKPVSILKPVRGTDPEMYESLRNHCLQDYPEYEIIFGVHEADDPALEFIHRLKAEFPHREIRVEVCREILGTNIKVSNLVHMAKLAKYEFLLVNDSDIRVQPNYLQQVIREFENENVGLVTCLYRGKARQGLWSKLEAVGINTDFCAGVLMARGLEGEIRFGLGSTLAIRKSDLAAIGGFEGLVDYLADDYEIGARIARRGKRVAIAEPVVETYLPEYSLRGFVNHQLRWARGIRDSRPGGYFGLVTTYGVAWALLTLVLSRGALWAWVLLCACLAARLLMSRQLALEVLHDQQIPRLLWLVPLRDCIALGLWACAYAGHTVVWRGSEFVLEKGKLKLKIKNNVT